MNEGLSTLATNGGLRWIPSYKPPSLALPKMLMTPA